MTKKTILLALALIMMGAASVNAQVRIGGDANPNESAVLDLNATDATNDGELGLALPRVKLTSTASFYPLKAHVAGMTVYNTETVGDVTPGTYYNDGLRWVRVGTGALTVDTDGGLTIISPMAGNDSYTFGIATDGVTTTKIANGAVTAAKLNAMGATANQALVYNGSAWVPTSLSTTALAGGSYSDDYIIVYNGAYNGPGAETYTTDLAGNFSADWTNSVFTAQNKDLLWAPVDAVSGTVNSFIASLSCPTDWRLPNLKELQVLYEAMGGHGGAARGFYAMPEIGKGIATFGCEPMQSLAYWSSTKYSSSYIYSFSFNNATRINNNNDSAKQYLVRCVRSL
jgi:uncharacterized protein (TIGR02145 family)